MKFDNNKVHKVAKILLKYDCKLPFACMIELSKLIKEPVRSTKQDKEKEYEK